VTSLLLYLPPPREGNSLVLKMEPHPDILPLCQLWLLCLSVLAGEYLMSCVEEAFEPLHLTSDAAER
jgi:hypothetical protein